MSVVYAISDLHGQLPEVPRDADALLIVGDICPDFATSTEKARMGALDKGGARQADWLDTEFRAWLAPLFARNCRVVAIWGNHDFVGEHPSLVPDLPWTLLQDSETTLNLPGGPLRAYGTPWVPGLPYWAFYARDEALEARARMIPEGLDVLMTHGPPLGAGDFIPTSPKQREKYGNYNGTHVGDRALKNELPAKDPLVTVCGHIHEARGVYGLKDYSGTIYNCAAVDEFYRLHAHPFTRLHEFS